MNLSKYFMSEAYKYVFTLCYLDKDARMELLGITEELYGDKENVRVGIDYRSSLGKDDFISMEKDQDVIIANKGEFSMINQEETEFAKTNIENHIL